MHHNIDSIEGEKCVTLKCLLVEFVKQSFVSNAQRTAQYDMPTSVGISGQVNPALVFVPAGHIFWVCQTISFWSEMMWEPEHSWFHDGG